MMKRIVIFSLALTLGIALAQAQPKSRVQNTAAAGKTDNGTALSERAKSQYTGQMPAPSDVVWKRDIYRILDLTKEANAALYYPVEPLGDRVNLFTLVLRLVVDGKVPAYEYRSDGNELFTEENKYKVKDLLEKFYIYYEEKNGKISVADADIPSGEVLSYFIKESSYYDQRTATTGTKVTAICPVQHRSGDYGDSEAVTKFPMFWLNYDEVSAYFGMTPVMTSSFNNVSNMSLDDYFVKHQYEGEIYKTANLQNKLLTDEAKGDTALRMARERIEGELRGFEHNLWGTAEPEPEDTTVVESKSFLRRTRTAKATAKNTPQKAQTKPTRTKAPSAKKEKASTKNSSSSSSGSGGLSVRRQKR
ncbi:MAG: gliding motility protein GldN [Bacteroidaceae bacterium]|nr:gliding motility protein GldN [Bacteroidaceae bacterium]